MTQYHEPAEYLNEETRNIVRALNSLIEEVEAVDWYHQRVVASNNEELKSIMAHNREEEIEHAVMIIEWLRRNMTGWDKELRTYLFTEGPITRLEENVMVDETSEESSNEGTGLNIGNLK